MSTRDAIWRLIDKQSNEYYVTVPSDVNQDSIEDILLAMHQGIVKLQGYKLISEAVYRLPDTRETDGRSFKFYKKVYVYQVFPDVDEKDFSDAIADLLDKARAMKINKPVITTIEGKPIKKDGKGSAYIDWSVKCAACNTDIKGKRPVSYSDGIPSRAQMFEPTDPAVSRVKPGSKLRLCPSCTIKTIPLPEVQAAYEETLVVTEDKPIITMEAPVKPSDSVLKERNTMIPPTLKKDLEELLALSRHDSGVSLEYFKGMVYGVVKSLLNK